MRLHPISPIVMTALVLGCTQAPNPPTRTTSVPVPVARGPRPPKDSRIQPEELIGKTVGEIVDHTPIYLEKGFVIEESLGVGRGVKGTGPDEEEVWLYVSKDKAQKKELEEWTLEQFRHVRITGAVIRDASSTKIAGNDVIISNHLGDLVGP
jgi:hypothetical protein